MFFAGHAIEFLEFLLIDAGFQVQALRAVNALQLILVPVWVGERRVQFEHIDDVLHLEVNSKFLESVAEAVHCNLATGLA